MGKEIINKKIIAQDIKECYQKNIRYLLLAVAILIPVWILLCYLLIKEKSGMIVMISTVSFVLLSSIVLMSIINRWIYIQKLKKGDFRIVEDTLAEIIQSGDVWGRYELRSRLWLSPYGVYRLRFSRYGEILLYDGVYYRFSPTYYMTDKGVYDRAKVGEDYYLVFIGKRPVPMHLYSKELFVLKD